MSSFEHLDFAHPDEVRDFPHGHVDILNTNSGTVGRMILEPDWKWSNDIKPIAGTEWCEAPHSQYHIAGTLHVVMADGQEFDVGPGEYTSLPAGHDAWVVGNEPVIAVDFAGMSNFAVR